MVYIDYKHNPPADNLIDEGNALTQQLLAITEAEQRKQFIKQHDDFWGKLKDHLLNLSNGKCWYTEAREIVSSYHVDHFRPKNETKKLVKNCPFETDCNADAYWWLAFAYENYRLCGSIPNTTKHSYFPLRKGSCVARDQTELEREWIGLLDPTVEDDVLWLSFSEDGKVYPACDDDSSWEAQRVFLSIRVYNLDAIPLVEARIEIQNKCKLEVARIRNLISAKDYNYNPLVRDEIHERMRTLRRMSHPESELSAVAKCYLLSQPEAFIRKIAVS